MKTLVFDGNNAAWRLMKKLPILTSKGVEIQVVYGFLRLVRSVISQFEADTALVCWDSGRSKERLKIYPNYKGNRDHDSTAERRHEMGSINKQIHLLKEVLPKLNVAQIVFPDTEADDLMGIATEALEGDKVVISSDRDAYHLIDERTSIWSPIKLEHYTAKNFFKYHQLTPQQWLELRALTGDRGDNIEGVAKGFGEKTAQELITQYGSIEKLFSASVEKRVSKLGNRYSLLYAEGAREKAFRNLLLMDLRLPIRRTDGPKIVNLMRKNVDNKRKIDVLEVREYFDNQQFDSLRQNLAVWLKPFSELDS